MTRWVCLPHRILSFKSQPRNLFPHVGTSTQTTSFLAWFLNKIFFKKGARGVRVFCRASAMTLGTRLGLVSFNWPQDITLSHRPSPSWPGVEPSLKAVAPDNSSFCPRRLMRIVCPNVVPGSSPHHKIYMVFWRETHDRSQLSFTTNGMCVHGGIPGAPGPMTQMALCHPQPRAHLILPRAGQALRSESLVSRTSGLAF